MATREIVVDGAEWSRLDTFMPLSRGEEKPDLRFWRRPHGRRDVAGGRADVRLSGEQAPDPPDIERPGGKKGANGGSIGRAKLRGHTQARLEPNKNSTQH